MNELPYIWHCFERAIITLQNFHRLRIYIDTGEDLLVTNTASGIGVRDLNEFLNGVFPVSDHMRGNPFGYRHNVVVNNKNAIVLTRNECLDEDRVSPRLCQCRWVELPDFAFISQVDEHAPSMIPIKGLDHYGIPQATCLSNGFVNRTHHHGSRNRDTDLMHEPKGKFLVTGYIHCDVGCIGGYRRPNPALELSVPKLNE